MNKDFRLLLVGLFASLLLLLTYIFLLKEYLYAQEIAKINERHLHLVHKVDDFISQKHTLVSALGENSDVEELLQNNSSDNLFEVEKIFFEIVKSNAGIMQLRVIDADGMERVRIDRTVSNIVMKIPAKELQNKAHRDYFQRFIKFLPQEMGFSNLDLNIEHKRVEIPWRPTLRIGYPIFVGTKRLGIIVVNYEMKEWLHDFTRVSTDNIYLVDDKGEFIIHPKNGWEWSHYQTGNRGFYAYFPDLKHISLANAPMQLQSNLFVKPLKLFEQNAYVLYELKVSLNDMLFYNTLEVALVVFLAILFVVAPSVYLVRQAFAQVHKAYKEKRMQEAMLLQQSKLASMGEMLSAIAHQWRQPLNSVGLVAQDLPYAYRHNELDEAYLINATERIMKQLRLMSETIDEFRNFFLEVEIVKTFNLLDKLQELRSLFWAQLESNNITLIIPAVQEEQKRVYLVKGLPNELKQILLNLLANSVDAIKAIANANEIQRSIEISLKIEEGIAQISLDDYAGGIPKEVSEKMFEPYFTTKEMGTGLGLFIVRTILQKHLHGSLSYEEITKEQQGVFYTGSRFIITFASNLSDSKVS